jgi:hypothetical protein
MNTRRSLVGQPQVSASKPKDVARTAVSAISLLD